MPQAWLPAKAATTWVNPLAGNTSRPCTKEASRAFSLGTIKALAPALRAAWAMANTPRTGRKLPSKPNSPVAQTPCKGSGFCCPVAIKSARAIGRSKPGPSLRRSAGAILTTTRLWGTRKPLLRRAERTRSRASLPLVSPNPTSCKPGSPGARSTST